MRLSPSIVVVGVGQGPFDDMQRYDDMSCGQKWDNVQFVRFVDGMFEDRFLVQALQEIPDQFREIRKRGLL